MFVGADGTEPLAAGEIDGAARFGDGDWGGKLGGVPLLILVEFLLRVRIPGFHGSRDDC